MSSIESWIQSIDINNLLDIFDIQISIAVILVFTLFRGAFASGIIKVYYKIVKKNKKAKDSSVYRYLTTLSVFIGVYLAIHILPTSKQVLYYMNIVFKIAAIIFVTKCLTTLTSEDSIVMKYFIKRNPNKAVTVLFAKVARFLMWVVSCFIMLYELGYNLNGLAAGLGVGAACITLAAQDLVKSLLGGISILADKPFVIGDWIECGTYAGTVIDITYRSTRIKTVSNSIITIPNSVITSNYVINWSRLASRRMDLVLNLHLDTPTDTIRKLVKQIKFVLENNSDVIKDTVQVHTSAIAASSVDVSIYFYVKETDYVKFLGVKENILYDILDVVVKENVDLAYPTQTIYLNNFGEEHAFKKIGEINQIGKVEES